MCAAASRPSVTTIRDVAARAGVSIATVSRAMRGGSGVDPETRRRVEEAARSLRYRPSSVARSLRMRTTRTIGLIVSDIENPYFPLVVRAVEDAARERHYAVILADSRRDVEREIQSLETLAEHQVDGLLLASSALTDRHRAWIADRPCPVVFVNSSLGVPGVPAVLSDNEAGGRLAAEHVLRLGHRRVAYIAARPSHDVAVEERLAGVRAALRDGGHDAESLRVVTGDGGVEAGERVTARLLARSPGISALLCYNDLTAVGALRGLRSLGLRVPQDVSVVGFDDIELAPYVDPALTTIRQDTEDMGRWAVRTLEAVIDSAPDAEGRGAMKRPLERRIPVELVVRASTARASSRPS